MSVYLLNVNVQFHAVTVKFLRMQDTLEICLYLLDKHDVLSVCFSGLWVTSGSVNVYSELVCFV